MSPPPRPRPCPRAPPPALPDELIEEILVRVPPDDPASLARAAVACRRWSRLVADPAFRRRRLALHGAAPPLLGLLCDGIWTDGEEQPPFGLRFVPTSSCRPPRPRCLGIYSERTLFDARRGRVLLHAGGEDDGYREFVVWDPVMDHLAVLPVAPRFAGNVTSIKATVLCANDDAATGACDDDDHLDCCHRGGPFTVVLVGTNEVSLAENGKKFVRKHMFFCTYSSKSGAWSDPIYEWHLGHDLDRGRIAVVGNVLFLTVTYYDWIIEYDLGKKEMSRIDLPYARKRPPVELTTLEDGQLGFARVEDSSQLCLWSSDTDEGGQVTGGWTPRKVIDLKSLFPVANLLELQRCLVGFLETVCVAVVEVRGELFTIDMKSGMMKKEKAQGRCSHVVPYIDFCYHKVKNEVCIEGS